MNEAEKERLIKKDIESIENRVRHAFNQGYDMGLKESRSENPNTCGDAISRQAVDDAIYDYSRSCDANYQQIMEFIEKIPSVSPQQRTGRWILADEQNEEDVANDNYRFICSECQCSDIHAKGTKVPYCWKCGAKMEVEE